MKTYIAYNTNTGEILCFISCKEEIDTEKVFVNFENYEVLVIDGTMPQNYNEYYVENGELKKKEEEEE